LERCTDEDIIVAADHDCLAVRDKPGVGSERRAASNAGRPTAQVSAAAHAGATSADEGGGHINRYIYAGSGQADRPADADVLPCGDAQANRPADADICTDEDIRPATPTHVGK
jgi:hypothetical protein